MKKMLRLRSPAIRQIWITNTWAGFTKLNNNILEQLNGTFRERTKVVRSFDNPVGAIEFAAGMQTYYNYIRPHQGIGGLTPAEMAGIVVEGENKWMTLIQNAAHAKTV